MLFNNKPLVQKSLDTDIKHRAAATGLDRKSVFYDKVLAQEFKKYFVFIRPGNTVDNNLKDNINASGKHLVKK